MEFRGCNMTWWRSRLMTMRMKAEAYMAKSLRKQSTLQRASPPCHCTVTFHTASRGITTKVIIRSADTRLNISGRRWEGGRRPRPTLAKRARLLQAAKTKSTKVAPTRNWAALVKLGVSHFERGGVQVEGRVGGATVLVGGASDDIFSDILQRWRKIQTWDFSLGENMFFTVPTATPPVPTGRKRWWVVDYEIWLQVHPFDVMDLWLAWFHQTPSLTK